MKNKAKHASLVPWVLHDDFESKSKKLEKIFSIASNLTRLEIETDRYVKNIVFAITISSEKRLGMSLTLSPVWPCIVNTGRSKCMFVEIVILFSRYKAEPCCVD